MRGGAQSHFVDLPNLSRHALVSAPGQPILQYRHFDGNGFHLRAVSGVVQPLSHKLEGKYHNEHHSNENNYLRKGF